MICHFFMFLLFNVFFFGACTSCRTIDKCTSSVDSTTVASHATIEDVSAEAELKALLQRFKETFTITIRETTFEGDSSGNFRESVHETEFRHTTAEESDAVEQKEDTNLHAESRDSSASSKSSTYKNVEKDTPSPIPKVFTVLVILIMIFIKVKDIED